MFVDHAIIHCLAGVGGNGCNSYYKSRHKQYKVANGGDGGNGGSIYLVASDQVRTLLDVKLTKTYRSKAGKHGSSNNKTGAEGEDFFIPVPIGTEVFDDDTGDLLVDLCEVGQQIIVARGGAGGKGNNRKEESLPGSPGDEKNIRFELKVIADIGLVGFPNAGKSTLISRISKAQSRIAAFPFTTKEPILGVLQSGYGDSIVIADIPGLIEGANKGKGLGHRFLRHVERTRTLLHLVDMAATEARDPVQDYRIILDELSSYSPILGKKPMIVVANKMDVPEAEEYLKKFRETLKIPVFAISAATGEGIDELIKEIFKLAT